MQKGPALICAPPRHVGALTVLSTVCDILGSQRKRTQTLPSVNVLATLRRSTLIADTSGGDRKVRDGKGTWREAQASAGNGRFNGIPLAWVFVLLASFAWIELCGPPSGNANRLSSSRCGNAFSKVLVLGRPHLGDLHPAEVNVPLVRSRATATFPRL
jgi:hypothetical protein